MFIDFVFIRSLTTHSYSRFVPVSRRDKELDYMRKIYENFEIPTHK